MTCLAEAFASQKYGNPASPDDRARNGTHPAGTLQGRPTVESFKTKYTITAQNEVDSTQTIIELQVLVPPSKFEYTYSSVIYKAGKLEFGAWYATHCAGVELAR